MATVQPQRANGSPHPSHTHTDPGPQHPIGPAPGPLRRPALKTRCNRSNIGLLSAQIPAARRRSSALLQPSSAPRKTAPASPHATRSETLTYPTRESAHARLGKILEILVLEGKSRSTSQAGEPRANRPPAQYISNPQTRMDDESRHPPPSHLLPKSAQITGGGNKEGGKPSRLWENGRLSRIYLLSIYLSTKPSLRPPLTASLRNPSSRRPWPHSLFLLTIFHILLSPEKKNPQRISRKHPMPPDRTHYSFPRPPCLMKVGRERKNKDKKSLSTNIPPPIHHKPLIIPCH